MTRCVGLFFCFLLSINISSSKRKRFVVDEEVDLVQEVKRLSTQMAQMSSRLHAVEEENRQLRQNQTKQAALIHTGPVATYVRWGRSDCPANGTELIYDGYVGGSNYNESGGSANPVCLTKSPIWGHYDDGLVRSARMFGAEYEFFDRIGHGTEFFGHDLKDYDVPCAVCGTNRRMVIMIPGRNACLGGWTMEYHGYLVGNWHQHQKAQDFVCLDISPTTVGRRHADENGFVFYFVETVCGSLNCPPYIHGEELTCVVCSK